MPTNSLTDDVAFIVPNTSGMTHYLYFRDGRIVEIDPHTGLIQGVSQVPDKNEIRAISQEQDRSESGDSVIDDEPRRPSDYGHVLRQ